MHYRNGREAHEGDPVLGETYKGSGDVLVGKLYNLQPGSVSCNAQLAYPIMGGTGVTCVTVGELYHAADAFAAIQTQITKPIVEPVRLDGPPASTTS